MKSTFLVITLFAATYAAPKLHFQNALKPQNHPAPRVAGGNLADPHSIPFQAFLEFWAKHSGWYCGGTLISQNYVLTSATCATTALEVLITLGAHNVIVTEFTQINLYSKEIQLQDDYEEGNYINDLALVKLPKTISYTPEIQPATLPTRSDVGKNFVGALGKVSGWGSDDGFDETLFPLLRYGNVQVLENDDEMCLHLTIRLNNKHLCTLGADEDEDVGPINADAGGPFVVDGVVVGVVSFGVAYWLPDYPTAHTRVDGFLDWIEANSDVVVE